MYLLITGASGHIGSSIAYQCNKSKIKTILLTRSKKKKVYLKKSLKIVWFKRLKTLKKIKIKLIV
jgi:short-subunit dehydrogenase